MIKKRPNILLISIDSLRADHLSLYGYKKETSPYLTELAYSGAVYDSAFTAANWTGASVTSILTGLYPTVHGYTNKRYYLDNGRDSIASILRANGYFTICFSNNMYISDKSGLHAGFADFRYRGAPINSAKTAAKKQSRLLQRLKDLPGVRTKAFLKNIIDSTDKATALTRDDGAYATEVALQKWLRSHDRQQPFFAYIHYQEPHSLYFPPYPYRRRFFSGGWLAEAKYLSFDHMSYYAGKTGFTESQVNHYLELYDGEITYLDWRLGRLFDFLRRQNLFDDTVIFVTADHGEMFGENGYFWHAFNLYDPLIRVPLVARYPEWFAPDRRSPDIVQTVDIVPTLLEGLNIEWVNQDKKQGESFLHGSRRTAALTETYNPELMVDRWLQRRNDLNKADFAHYLRDLFSYRTHNDKMIFASTGAHEFYDLQNDPAETINLYGAGDERIKARQNELKQWTGSFTPHVVASDTQPGFDKATWEKMKALGYA